MEEEVTTAPADLPEGLELPLTSGRPHWYWVGGAPAIDLVNTLRERWRRRVECLVHGDDLAAWLDAAGLPLPRGVPVSSAHVVAVQELREAIDGLVCAAVQGGPSPEASIAVLDGWLQRAAPRPRLAVADAGPELQERGPGDPVEAAIGLLALDAARVLGTPMRARLRVCAAPDCSARFLDRSPAGRRRWCSMAGCGNRAKVRRHRSRA